MISAAFIDIFRDGGWFIRKGKYCHGFQWYVKRNCYFKVKTCQTKFTPLLKRRVKAPMWAKNAKSGLQKPTSSCRALVMPSGLEISGDFLIFVTRTEEVILSLLKYTGLWIVLKMTIETQSITLKKNLTEFCGLRMKNLTECDLSNESYWAVLYVARLFILTFESVEWQLLSRTFPRYCLLLMLHKVVLTFETVDEIWKCDHSNKSRLSSTLPVVLFIML